VHGPIPENATATLVARPKNRHKRNPADVCMTVFATGRIKGGKGGKGGVWTGSPMTWQRVPKPGTRGILPIMLPEQFRLKYTPPLWVDYLVFKVLNNKQFGVK